MKSFKRKKQHSRMADKQTIMQGLPFSFGGIHDCAAVGAAAYASERHYRRHNQCHLRGVHVYYAREKTIRAFYRRYSKRHKECKQ